MQHAELSLVGYDGASKEDWIRSLGFYLLDLKIQTQTRKVKENKNQKSKNKNLRSGTNRDKRMSVTMNVLFYPFPSGAPRGTSERRLCSRAGLLLFNSCLLKVYYVPGTVPRIWVQWWKEKSKISLEVAWCNHAKGRVTWT